MTSEKDNILPGEITGAVFLEADAITGYVFDSADPSRQFAVELLLDGWPCKLAQANMHDDRSPLATAHDHGFILSLPQGCTALEAEVRLANLGTPVAAALDLLGQTPDQGQSRSTGEVTWDGGLRISGHVTTIPTRPKRIRGLIAEDIVFDVAPNGWAIIASGDSARTWPRFDVHLPLRFADGKVHQLSVMTDTGDVLSGSPLSVVAFADGLESWLAARAPLESEQLRGKLFDELVPASIPFHWVEDWIERFPLRAPPDGGPEAVAVVLFGDDHLDESLRALEGCTVHWLAGTIPQEADGLSFNGADLATFLETEAADCDVVVFARSGTELHPQALANFRHVLARPGDHLASADLLIRSIDGSRMIVGLPSDDPERSLEQCAQANLFAMSRRMALALATNEVWDPFRLYARAAVKATPIHLPGLLATCPAMPLASGRKALERAVTERLAGAGVRARTFAGKSRILPSIRLQRIVAAESITILLPVRNRRDATRATVECVRALSSRHRIDLRVIDMSSSDEGTLRFLSGVRGQHEHVERVAEAANIPRVLNAEAAKTRSRYICFFEAGSLIEDGSFFEELIARCSPKDVAGAGPMLVSAGGFVGSAGLVLGTSFGAAAIGAGGALDDEYHAALLAVARACSALPLPGFLVKRNLFASVGGFDAGHFKRVFHSIDLSMTLRAKGCRLVVSPHVRITLPDESRWLQDPATVDNIVNHGAELAALRRKWGDALHDDAFYNPSLCLDRRPFSALAWPPRQKSLHSPREGA